MLKSRKGQEGFTLIELLVVVLIIGILAAIAIPAFLGQKKGAQDSNAKSLLRNAAIAMETQFSDSQDFATLTGAADSTALNTMMAKIEPNITWVKGDDDAIAKEDQVHVLTGTITPGSDNAYVLNTESQSGSYFTYVRDNTAKVLRCKTPTSATGPAITAISPATVGCGTGNSTW